jgi:hypothetical protein
MHFMECSMNSVYGFFTVLQTEDKRENRQLHIVDGFTKRGSQQE